MSPLSSRPGLDPDEEPDVTMADTHEGGPGEDPDFDEAGEGAPDAPRDEASAEDGDPLKGGLTPSDYDEYGGGPNRDNSPEKLYETEREKNERQQDPGHSPLG